MDVWMYDVWMYDVWMYRTPCQPNLVLRLLICQPILGYDTLRASRKRLHVDGCALVSVTVGRCRGG